MMTMTLRQKILLALTIIVGAALGFSLFKNIQYPLVWNDEAETVMYGERVLQYGYPKISDGKNIIYNLELPDKTIGINRTLGAYTGTVWGHFYAAAAGVLLARFTDDIYTKTAMLRIPFAAAGMFGVMLMALGGALFFKKRLTMALLFAFFFLSMEALSVSLALHLREVRYYSIVVFLVSFLFFLYAGYKFQKRIAFKPYALCTIIASLLLFNTFPPAYFAFIASVGLYELSGMLIAKRLRGNISGIVVPCVSFMLVVPEMIFFDTLHISSEFRRFFDIQPELARQHAATIFDYFMTQEFLAALLAAKVMALAMGAYALSSLRNKKEAKAIVFLAGRFYFSLFVSLFCIIYVFLIARMPLPVVFERYFIVLQPAAMLALALDLSIICDTISCLKNNILRRAGALIISVFLVCVFLKGLQTKMPYIKGHLYEMDHQYKGPLDFAIPYIIENYKHPEELVIATNYEESSYMYYLKSRVIMGYVGNNVEKDAAMTPDVIILRKRFAYTNPLFDRLLTRVYYDKISFPVYDYPVNNIPELSNILPHLFETVASDDPETRLDIYVQTTNPSSAKP
ncbi:MAG: hypothetical protein V2A66_09730 [Pseudomonadota bacterium]